MSKDFDTDEFLKPAKRYLTKDGMAVGRIGIHLWRWGGGGLLVWLAFFKPESNVKGVTKDELTTIMAAHEAMCEQIIIDAREQIKELNRRMDMLLRQRWNMPPRGGEGLMRKDQQ